MKAPNPKAIILLKAEGAKQSAGVMDGILHSNGKQLKKGRRRERTPGAN